MKKAICIFLFVLLLVPSGIYSFAEEPHTHTGELEFLRTEEGLEIPCCGVYRCSECGETFEKSISPADVGMPIIQIEGSLDGISKEKKVTVHVNYNDGQIEIASPATLKWQGASSLLYPKKNYNIQFLKENGSKNKVELTSAWGEQSKYCLKANWVDFSGLRNVVSAKLFGEIVHSRCKDDPLDKLVNGGAIDGFPVLLYHDGDFQGLYTLNTPKDKWIFDMTGKSEREGLLFGENWSDSVMIKNQIPDVNDPSLDGWEVEYCSTEDDPDVGISWLGEGMNRLISFVTDHNGEDFKAGINTLTDIDRCIDYMLYIFFIGACDNVGKNILWTTYDGNIYIPSAYDLDTSWGLFWTQDFPDLNLSSTWGSFSPLRQNLLFTRILDNYSEEITARYLDLRESILSYGNIARQFHGLADRIPACVYEAESTKWPTEPNQDTNNLAQILQYTKDRIDCLDKLFQVTVEEKTEKAWRAEFACEDGAKVLVYPSQDYSVPPVRAAEAFSIDSETGELTKSGGQINFKVMAPADAIVQIEVVPETAYKNLKKPADTGEENTYRITKISGDLTVHVRLIEDPPEPEGWNITFDCDPDISVWVYPGSDYTAQPVLSTQTVSVESGTGIPTKTDGQVNFKLETPNAGDTFEISISPESYKNLKGPDETGLENVYRITKIKGDLTVHIRLIEEIPEPEGWNITFDCDPDISVWVYPGSDYTAQPVLSTQTVSVESGTGIPTKTDGQVNFKLETPNAGDTFEISISPESYKNLKGPDETGLKNVYGITEINGDLTVHIRLIEEIPEPEGWNITFDCDPEVKVWVYPGADYTAQPVLTTQTVSVESGTGIPTKTDGQVNFKLETPNAGDTFEIVISPESYKNLKGPDETGLENVYGITEINGDLTVTVRVISASPDKSKPYPLGDVDKDGSITAADARLALRAAVELEEFAKDPTSPMFLLSDVTKDGKVTAEDARLILRTAVGLESFGDETVEVPIENEPDSPEKPDVPGEDPIPDQPIPDPADPIPVDPPIEQTI